MRPNNISAASSIVKPPCTRDCKDRSIDCHSICEKYINYVKEKEKLRIEMAEQSRKDADFVRYRNDVYRRIARSH